jgi:hypothetical protein
VGQLTLIFFVYSTEHSGISDKIKTFLDLNQPENDLTDDSSGDDDEEDGFEHITEEVIEELNTECSVLYTKNINESQTEPNSRSNSTIIQIFILQ